LVAAHSGRRWPTGTDYSRAIQHAPTAFGDQKLRQATVATNLMGMPLVASGQNAVVYMMRGAGHDLAIRCFTTPPTDGAARYGALTAHLGTVPPTVIADSFWLDDGISVDDARWPVVIMPWVAGQPLSLVVEDSIGDPSALRRMADEWLRTVIELQRADITHGDLQHGNIMVRDDGTYCLVDLDGIWVPTMTVGPPDESGHPNYQHPRRTASQWGRHGDSFSALLIETGLRALAADPSLERFLSGENLLFDRADLLDTSREIWVALDASLDPEVGRLARVLRARANDHPGASMHPLAELRSGRSSAVRNVYDTLPTGRITVQPSAGSAAQANALPVAGWYTDTAGEGDLRYWDGAQWTTSVVRLDTSTNTSRTASAAADWYPDPTGRFDLRFWNGLAWTEHAATRAATHTNPL
jgi:hypothetical protein